MESKTPISDAIRAGDFAKARALLEAMGKEVHKDPLNYARKSAYVDLCDVYARALKGRYDDKAPTTERSP